MSDEKPKTTERAIAQQTQEMVEVYLLSLVFTLLALSIQTAKFGDSVASDALELFGWLAFVVSGLAGLSRLEWAPHIRVQMSHQSDFENEIFKLKELQLQGQTELHVLETGRSQLIEDRIRYREDAIRQLAPHVKKLERRMFTKYRLHKYGFVIGVLLIAGARSFVPATTVLRSIHWL